MSEEKKENLVHSSLVLGLFHFMSQKFGSEAEGVLKGLLGVGPQELSLQQLLPRRQSFQKALGYLVSESGEPDILAQAGRYLSQVRFQDPRFTMDHPLVRDPEVLMNDFLDFYKPFTDARIRKRGKRFSFLVVGNEVNLAFPFLQGIFAGLFSQFGRDVSLWETRRQEEGATASVEFVIRTRGSWARFWGSLLPVVVFLTAGVAGGWALGWGIGAALGGWGFGLWALVWAVVRNRGHRWDLKRERFQSQSLFQGLHQQLVEIHSQQSRLEKAFDSINALSRSILSTLDMKTAVNLILKSAKDLLECERATLFLYDAEAGEFFADLEDEGLTIRFSADQGIVGKIGKLKETMMVNDPYATPFFNKSVDKKASFVTRNLLGAPILDSEDKLIGVIEVVNKVEGPFLAVDEDILASLCSYASLGFQRILLFHQRIAQEHKRLLDVMGGFLPQEPLVTGRWVLNLGPVEPRQFFTAENLGFPFEGVLRFKRSFVADAGALKEVLGALAANTREAGGHLQLTVSSEVVLDAGLVTSLGLTEAMRRWNRGDDLGEDFTTFVTNEFPLLPDQVEQVRRALSYRLCLVVQDDAGGMEEEVFSKAFYPFFTTKPGHRGAGLKQTALFASVSKAGFQVRNERGKGLTVILKFPVS